MEDKKRNEDIFKKYRTFIERYISLDDEEWELFRSTRSIKVFQKGDVILQQGDVCGELYFITEGLARGFMIDEKGRDFTWSIFFNDPNATVNNLFITDYKSFVRQEASSMQIEALEDTEAVVVSYEDLVSLSGKSEKGIEFTKLMAQEAYCYLHDLVIQRQIKSAQERFDLLMQKTPFLLEKVPQYHIATFLGITPQHLSRLKKSYG